MLKRWHDLTMVTQPAKRKTQEEYRGLHMPSIPVLLTVCCLIFGMFSLCEGSLSVLIKTNTLTGLHIRCGKDRV